MGITNKSGVFRTLGQQWIGKQPIWLRLYCFNGELKSASYYASWSSRFSAYCEAGFKLSKLSLSPHWNKCKVTSDKYNFANLQLFYHFYGWYLRKIFLVEFSLYGVHLKAWNIERLLNNLRKLKIWDFGFNWRAFWLRAPSIWVFCQKI